MPFLFDPASWDEWKAALDDHAADLISIALMVTVAVVLVRTVLARTMHELLTRAAIRRHGIDAADGIERRAETIVRVTVRVLISFIVFIGFVLVLDEFNKNVSALIAGAGVVGIAVGLASQQLIKDFINGALILMEDQFSVGDVVEISGVSGSVIDINLRRTLLRDMDGHVHTVPNSLVQVTTNMTQGFSRINLNIGVSYDEDVDRVIAIINDECAKLVKDFPDDVIKPPEVLRVDSLAESSVQIKVAGDVKAGRQWDLTGALRKRLKNRFDTERIEIPYRYLALTSKQLELVTREAEAAADGKTGSGIPGVTSDS